MSIGPRVTQSVQTLSLIFRQILIGAAVKRDFWFLTISRSVFRQIASLKSCFVFFSTLQSFFVS